MEINETLDGLEDRPNDRNANNDSLDVVESVNVEQREKI
jgi:hypothetical protein